MKTKHRSGERKGRKERNISEQGSDIKEIYILIYRLIGQERNTVHIFWREISCPEK
jgi:hypothetical protein